MTTQTPSEEKSPPKKASRSPSGSAAAKKGLVQASATPHVKRSLKLAPAVLVTGSQAEKPVCAQPKDIKYRKLTKKELHGVEETLKAMRDEILHDLRKEISEARSRATGMLADPVDQATEAYDDDISYEIASASEDELEQIQIALEKIEKGTYGLCEECEAPISPSRLQILPYATACVGCRSKREHERKPDTNTNWVFVGNEADSEDDT